MKSSYTISRNLLDGVETFLRVAERQSFRAAADDLGVSPSAVSQAIRTLEERIGVPLFIRTTRSVGLTEAGQRLHARAAPAHASLVAAWESARTLGLRPSGLLRINMPRAVVPLVIEPIIADFCARYPEVDVEVIAEDALVDLAASGHDAGIRIGELLEPDMVAVRLSSTFRYVVVATPAYLNVHGRPAAATDLRQHSCIRQRFGSGSMVPWRLSDGARSLDVAVKGRVIVSDHNTLIAMAERGLGLAQISEPLVAAQLADGRLESVLDHLAPTSPGLFLHYPSRAQMLPKLRAFIDHVKAAMADGRLASLVSEN
jgi:DNA-binding transcriptional LysR family regulator